MTKPAEGVAAPLEPSRQEFEKWGDETLGWRSDDFTRESKQFHSGESYESAEVQVAWLAWQARAAAVSKNLQQELERLQSEVAVRDEWLRFIDAKDLKIYHELRNKAGKSPR